MNLTNQRATIGLSSKLIPTNTNIFGQIQIGETNENINFADSDVMYSLQAFSAGPSNFTIDLSLGIGDNFGTWQVGAPQIETSTASGTCTKTDNLTIRVTAPTFFSVDPREVLVPITENDTPSQWAAKVRNALNLDSVVSESFNVSGENESIVLTTKPVSIVKGSNIDVPIYKDNIFGMNVEIDAGLTGVDSSATSTNTQMGIRTFGCLLVDADGKDFEGEPIGLNNISAILIKNNGSAAQITNGGFGFVLNLGNDSRVLVAYPEISASDQLEVSTNGDGNFQISVLGSI